MKVQLKYALFGVAFGAFFPMGAAIFEIIHHNLQVSLDALKYIHNQNPLLYIIDSAPIWLGIFALFGGIQQAKSNKLLNQFEEISKFLSESCAKLNIVSKDSFYEMKNDLDELTLVSSNMKSINESINNNINNCKGHSKGLSESTDNMLSSINNLFVFNEIANKGNTEITSSFLNFLAKIDEISNYFEQVKSIGKQINILALNSGIEASKIGEKGRGFSVIAKNIKDLAETTSDISSSIDNLLNETKGDVDSIKSKINQELENLESLNKTSKTLEEEMNIFRESVGNIFAIIQDTYGKNEEQNLIFNKLKSSIEFIESAYTNMKNSISNTIQKETKIVREISTLKQAKTE